jgi:hypothetical protein
MKYYIYHIPGVKIGVTQNLEQRAKAYKLEFLEVLELHTNIKEVSKREIELQKQYGYPVDKKEYWKVKRMIKHRKIDYLVVRTKGVANTDYKAMVSKRDYKASAAKVDWKANRAKINHELSRKKAIHHSNYINTRGKGLEKLKKPINQYDLQGNFIKKWDSATDIANNWNVSSSSISQCCKGKLKTAHKFIWKYA